MITDKVIYQYGNANEPNLVFYKQKFRGQLNNGIKEQRSTSALMDGSQRLNGSERNKRSTHLFQYEFQNPFFSVFTTDFINRVFYDAPKITFWYQVGDYDSTDADNDDYERPITKWFYNISDCTIPPSIIENQLSNRGNADQTYQVGLTLEKPFLYECTADIQYVDLEQYLTGGSVWNAFNWGASNWGSSFAPVDISTLTNLQKQQFFIDFDIRAVNYFTFLRDRFFARDTDYAGSYNYVINTTLSASTFKDVLLTDVFQESPTDNQIYRVEISQMQPDQEITLQNVSNNSGIKITWVDPSASPTDLVYNSYYNKLYSGATEIDVASNKYIVEATNDQPLYFSGLLNPRPFEAVNNETIRLTNNDSSTPTVKIDALLTY